MTGWLQPRRNPRQSGYGPIVPDVIPEDEDE